MDVVDDPDSKINPDYDFSFSLLEGRIQKIRGMLKSLFQFNNNKKSFAVVADWIKNHPEPSGRLFERALIIAYELKEPKGKGCFMGVKVREKPIPSVSVARRRRKGHPWFLSVD